MFTHIVFLIDTDVPEKSAVPKTTFCNSICLSCLRLLHLYTAESDKRGVVNKSKQAHTSVKWGYKFFSSKLPRTRIESHKLHDVKLKYFEEFENELHKRFEKTTDNVRSQCKPSDCLSKTFTEVLADFQWEKPDLMSPVKGRKHKKNINTHSNILILFSGCPKNGVELKKFTGKQVPDEDVFLDSLLPPKLFNEFCHVNKLTLNWIDTFPTNAESNNCDVSSARIIESAVAKTGGRVFPIGGVAQNGNPYFSHSTDLLNDLLSRESDTGVKDHTRDDGASILPVSSTLGSLFSQLRSISRKNRLPDEEQTSNTKICIGGKEIAVSLELSSIKSDTKRCRKQDTTSVDLSEVFGVGHSDAAENLTHLQAYALVSKHSVTVETVLHSCYMCAEKVQIGRGKKDAPSHGLFQRVLAALSARQSVMVLLCQDSGNLALLEPLTSQTATLSLLTQGSSLCVEKALMTQQQQDRVASLPKPASCDVLVQRLLTSKHIAKPRDHEEPPCRGFDGKLMDRWYLPGPGSSLKGLVNKLNDRIGDLPFLSGDEVSVLKQLQRSYKQEGKPPGLRETPTMPAPAVPDAPKPSEPDRLELPFRGKSSRASLSRTDMIMTKSAAVVKERGQTEKDDGQAAKDKQGREKPEIAAHVADFKNEEELKAYLTFTYGRVVSREITSVDLTIQTMVTVAMHYTKQGNHKDAEAKCEALLEDCLVLSGAKLREKYNTGDSASQEQKIAEYQAQVLLRLEILSNLVNKDQTLGEEDGNEEIVGLLRTLSFIWEPGALSQFMQSSLVYSYIHTLPHTLANIYDELMQPLPDMLANLLSPGNSTGDKSVLNASLDGNEEFGGPPSARTRSHGSVGPPSSQPPSNASLDMSLATKTKPGRKLVHHPSLADFGSKRQIVIQKAVKPKDERGTKRKRHDSGRRRRDNVSKALFGSETTTGSGGKRGGTKLERRQSVAVMERTRRTPKKMTKSKLMLKSPARNLLSPRRRMVVETPCHKQVNQSLFQHKQLGNQSMQEQTTLADPSHADLDTTDVIEESPEKSCGERSLKDTPTKGKRAKALLRRSFYSAGPLKRTRNLTQYFQLADRIAGRHRPLSHTPVPDKPKKLLSFDADPQFKSPDKKNSSFLLSQLVSSPSPAKTTPRKSTRTPSKLLADSPGFHTRSQAGLSRPGLFSPDAKLSSSLPRPPSSSSSHLFSPVSRRQSPRVFVAESETKSQRDQSHTTPVKSPVVGKVLFGLDSPSHNTRQKTAVTPTRASVRAALFAKSPAPRKNIQSPARAATGPTTLAQRLMSPSKAQSGERACRMSPRRLLDTQISLGFSPPKADGKENIEKGLPFESFTSNRGARNLNIGNLNGEDKLLTNPADKSAGLISNLSSSVKYSPVGKGRSVPPNHTSAQKTPSPHRKRTTKTPDSFDKWHRRKPRSNQSSPAPNKHHQLRMETAESNKLPLPDNLNTQTTVSAPGVKSIAEINMSQLGLLNSPGRRKRNLLLSPEKPVESPSKRRRTTRLETLGSDRFQSSGSLIGSQGFDTTGGSFNLSQASACSSDYFSTTNDEVFLSQSQSQENEFSSESLSQKSSDRLSQKIGKIKSDRSLFNKKHSTSESISAVLSPSRKTLPKLISEEFSCSDRPESPTFGITRASGRKRHPSGCTDSVLMDIDDSNSNNSHSSPSTKRSPALRKFSPSVSAKSLMHLIQSPLLASPAGEGTDGRNSPSHGNVKRPRGSDRTRRSLKLLN